MSGDELEPLRCALDAGEDAVWISVAEARGSVPRDAGTGMVATANAQWGSIGGGHLEYEALRMAREALADANAAAVRLERFPLAARLGQCCGGVATLALTRLAAGAHPWLDAAWDWLRADTPFMIAVAIESTAPEPVLAIGADRHEGSLGSASLDEAVLQALRMEPERSSGLVLVAGVRLLVRAVRPARFDIGVFGNGHVGRALVQMLGVLPFHVRWIDEREEDFPATVPANTLVTASDAPAREVASLPAGAAVVITTHSHAIDFEIAQAALARDDLAYVGMIGSRAKRRQLEARAHARGLDASRLTCPIGLPLFGGKAPGVVALAVAAELQALHEKRAGILPRARG